MHPLDFVSKKEYARYAEIGWLAENGYKRIEDGSQQRFDKVFKNHYGWWLVHNIIAHVMIGVLPIKMCFEFHDYTSRKMRK